MRYLVKATGERIPIESDDEIRRVVTCKRRRMAIVMPNWYKTVCAREWDKLSPISKYF